MNIDYDIALTHVKTRKKQTLIASLGVTIGVAIYLFMNSISAGFTKYSRDEIFKNNAHLKVFKDDEYCKPLNKDTSTLNIIVNPQITTTTKNIINPNELLNKIKQQNFITHAMAQVDLTVFYNMGKTQIKGSSSGVNILEYNAMFNNEKYMVGGSLSALHSNLNGIIIGKGIAEKLSLKLNSNVTVSSSYGVVKVLRVVGIFESGNGFNDNSKSYINIATAQQFLKEGRLRLIATSGQKRFASTPTIPTLIESGYPDFLATSWIGFLTTAGTPKPIIDRYNKELVKILRSPEVKEKLESMEFEIIAGTPEQFRNWIVSEIPRWGKVIKLTGAKAD
jgi:ABC-type lipoprotein release transport system permease subunit